MSSFKAIRGMNDILPEASSRWQQLEAVLRQLMVSYGYGEIRMPIVEPSQLFARGVGADTDVVGKEMYVFEDRNGDSLALRPEGTASCVRAALEHGLIHNQSQRLWYLGPMYRHERPQKGRYRQFYQLGVEALNYSGPDIDAEQLMMQARLWRQLGISDKVKLLINSLGTSAERKSYREKLVAYFQNYQNDLDDDAKHRLSVNPLRLLDSKDPNLQNIILDAPNIHQHLGPESTAHFEELCGYLDALNISYEIKPSLVRGLDYYNHTVYEWVTAELGAQGTICGGGRYDGLIELIGKKSLPATGFAMGIERILHLMPAAEPASSAEVYFIHDSVASKTAAMQLAEELRTKLPELKVIVHAGSEKFKGQFKRADKSGAKLALIIGADELNAQQVSVKYLRSDNAQQQVAFTALAEFCQNLSEV